MGDNAPAPYEPPLVEDLGTLEEITGAGTGFGPKEGINAKSG